MPQLDFFNDENNITANDRDDPGFREKIDQLFELSAQANSSVINAEMNEVHPVSRADLKRYVKKILDAAEAQEKRMAQNDGNKADLQLAMRQAADKTALDRGDPLVCRVLDASYKVGHEIHRLLGLLRFSPGKDAMWIARCAPDNFILPAMAEHFTLRFGDEPWAIIDEKRGVALVRRKGEEACFGPVSAFPFLLNDEGLHDHWVPTDPWEQMWQSYHRTIMIDNRKNLDLQRQLMPSRYWKYLPEKNIREPL